MGPARTAVWNDCTTVDLEVTLAPGFSALTLIHCAKQSVLQHARQASARAASSGATMPDGLKVYYFEKITECDRLYALLLDAGAIEWIKMPVEIPLATENLLEDTDGLRRLEGAGYAIHLSNLSMR